jgi:hypothetical protein
MKKKPSADVESLAEMLIAAHKRFIAACRTGSDADAEAEAADKKVGDFIARIAYFCSSRRAAPRRN